LFLFGIVFALALYGQPAHAQQQSDARNDTTKTKRDTTSSKPRFRFLHVNELETPFFTFRVGGGVLLDQQWFEQNAASDIQTGIIQGEVKLPEERLDRRRTNPTDVVASTGHSPQRAASSSRADLALQRGFEVRDARFLLRGRLLTQRPTVWQAGLMWDGAQDKFLVRQTGLMVSMPEIWGYLWIGRSKEGFSLNKVMVGYDGWTMERFTFSDASIPLLADGVKWYGYLPKHNLLWNLGGYADWVSKGQTFSHYEKQAALRAAYVRVDSATLAAGTMFHGALQIRSGTPTDDTLRLKSKPEASTAPLFIDTGKFHSTFSWTVGAELYYRPSSWLFGTEYYLQHARSPETSNPWFNGGDIVAAWLVTGEVRPYTTAGGYFRSITPRKSFWEGGPGAWEIVLRLSYSDLDSGTLRGGKFWRLTPQVNWYLNEGVRLEANYGYSKLDRFGLIGTTQFFQLRLQTQL
jgi:phosphate-selective porin OprO and OprP